MDTNTAAAVIAGLLGLIGVLGTAVFVAIRRNGSERHAQNVSDKAIDPESRSERTGEMSVAFWQHRFDDIDGKQDEILKEFAEIKAHMDSKR